MSSSRSRRDTLGGDQPLGLCASEGGRIRGAVAIDGFERPTSTPPAAFNSSIAIRVASATGWRSIAIAPESRCRTLDAAVRRRAAAENRGPEGEGDDECAPAAGDERWRVSQDNFHYWGALQFTRLGVRSCSRATPLRLRRLACWQRALA